MSAGRKATTSETPSVAEKRDLVVATMTVSPPLASERLTGGLTSISHTGQNTAWATGRQPPDRNVPRYTARKEYMQANHAGHPFAQSFMERHVGETEAEDKRGLSCAEGHSLIQSHQKLHAAGQAAAEQNLRSFMHQLIPEIPKPVFSWADFGKESTKQQSAAYATAVAKRTQDLNALAKGMTGMDNWESYARQEAGFMAWNDIQQHGTLSGVRHHEHSDVNPGADMNACEKCREDIVGHLEHHK